MIKEKIYNSFKLKLSNWELKRSLKKENRIVKVCSLSQAKTIGISFIVNKQDDLEKIRRILKTLADKGIQTYALGYIPVKKPNDFYLSQKSFIFFSDADLDFLLRPKNNSVIEFINTKFDILIDFSSEGYFPMNYMLRKSKAGFKVGWYGEVQPFDLMLNIDKKADVEYYFEQALYYLEKIK